MVLIYLAAVSLIGALTAPWIFWAAQALSSHSRFFQYVADHSFPLFVNRALLLTAAVILWPVLRALDLRSWRAVGLPKPAGHWAKVGIGFGLAFATVAITTTAALVIGARVIDDSPAILRKVPAIAWNGFVVGFTEEILFRGVFFGALRRAMAWPAALAASSVRYACVQFFTKVDSPAAVIWSSGFVVLGGMAGKLLDPAVVVPGLFTLTAAGLIFGLAYHRTGNLYFSIGLHAGWVFWAKMCNVLTDPVKSFSQVWFGSSRFYDGWVIFGLLASVLIVALRWKSPEGGGNGPPGACDPKERAEFRELAAKRKQLNKAIADLD
jgi:membrane protease YdiL (CAAX protease family)